MCLNATCVARVCFTVTTYARVVACNNLAVHRSNPRKTEIAEAREGRARLMSDLKDKAKEKIDDAADAAKKATEKVADKAKDIAHQGGKKLEEGGKRLQDA